MKKILIIIGTIFLLFPNTIKADTVDYDITHYYINADIEENGDLLVTELIAMDGSFNGYVRDIYYANSRLNDTTYANNKLYNASDIEMLEIAAKKEDNISFETIKDADFIPLIKDKAANQGYIPTKLSKGYSYKMYFKGKNETVLFRLTYRIKDVIVLHEDIAELYWTFIGSEYEDKIRDLVIKINLPENDVSDNFRIWAHGDLTGDIKKENNNQIIATVKKLNTHSEVDIRTTFSKDIINENLINKKSNQNALAEIIKVEEERADIANKERQQIKTIYYTLVGASIIYFITLIITWIYVYIKYDREYKSTFHNEYNREFIDDYNVEVIDYLVNKNITSNALSASILNLIYKKIIKVEELSTSRKKKNYKFTLIEHQNNSLNDTENYLIDFLFNKVGENNTFTIKELKEYAKGTKTYEKFSSSYTTWKNKVIQDGKNQEFFEKTGKAKGIGGLFLGIAIVVNVITFILNAYIPIVYFTFIAGFIFFIYTLVFNKRTKKGRDHYARWMSFKKFLQDFGTFDTKELPEITLWERYMVYAMIFGIADTVSKSMNVKMKELETSGVYVGSYTPTFTDWYMFNSINHNIDNVIAANRTAITQASVGSSHSSGSGFGGGFSSGGGFGGGGGGGHGF